MAGVVIVGAGLAGVKTAEALRTGEYHGPITLVGAEDEQPYDRPPLSKQVLRGERDVVRLWQPDVTGDLGLDLRLGVRATGIDGRVVVLSDGSRLGFDRAVIATGAKVRTVDALPQKEGVFYLRTVADSLALRAAVSEGSRVVVIGGGFIGCEVAASLRQGGAHVTIVEPLDAPLVNQIGPELAGEVVGKHADEGVEVRAGIGASGLTGDDRVTGVTLDDGSTVEADVVVIGVGVVPDTDWLEGSGVDLDDGVVVDDHLVSSVPDVYAVGDLARWYDQRTGTQTRAEHWTNATEMAEVAAANILGGKAVHEPVPYFWTDQYDWKVQTLGWTGGSDERRVLSAGPKGKRVVLYGRGGDLWGVAGVGAPALVRRMREQIAAHVSLDDAEVALT